MQSRSEVFAANRSRGRVAVAVTASNGVTRRQRVYEDGPLRVRFPNVSTGALEAMIVNTAGGVADGDEHEIALSVGENATLSLTTAAAEKVYRALGTGASITVNLDVATGGRLQWLPQETILFNNARLSRRFEVDVDEDATLLIAEGVVFGRSAMGETVEQGALADRWRVRRNGRLIFAEAIRLDDEVAALLREPAVANGGAAIATVLAIPGGDEEAKRVRATNFAGEVGVSTWNGIAVARLCARDSLVLRNDLADLIVAMGGTLPRLWRN